MIAGKARRSLWQPAGTGKSIRPILLLRDTGDRELIAKIIKAVERLDADIDPYRTVPKWEQKYDLYDRRCLQRM